jgi:hypothetical protein
VIDHLVLLLQSFLGLLDLRLEVVIGLSFLDLALLNQLTHFIIQIRVFLFKLLVLGRQISQDPFEVFLLEVVHLASQIFDLDNFLLVGILA